jgi:hypothetical protein
MIPCVTQLSFVVNTNSIVKIVSIDIAAKASGLFVRIEGTAIASGMPRKYIGPQIAVRIEPELLARIDALIPAFATAVHEPTRAEVVRGAVLKGIGLLEQEARLRQDLPPGKPPRRGK